LAEDGFVTIKEDVAIKGLGTIPNVSANEGYLATKADAFSRCQGVYNTYDFSDSSLFSLAIVSSVATDKFNGTINFSNTFTNDPKYKLYAVWQYSHTVDKDVNGYVRVSEEGNVIGIGRPYVDKLSKALSYYNSTVKPGIVSRLDTLYSDFPENNGLALITIKNSFTKNESLGEVSYSLTRTDDNTYIDEDGIKKVENNVSVKAPVHMSQEFNVFNLKELAQTQYTSTQGSISIQVSLKGSRVTPISSYLASATQYISPFNSYGTDTYLSDCSYSFSPLTYNFQITATYKYSDTYKEQNDLALTATNIEAPIFSDKSNIFTIA